MSQPTPRTFPAGEFIADELDARGWTPGRLGEAIGLPRREVDQLITGEKRITATISEHLGRAFGTSSAFWINLQKQHDKDN